MRQPAKAAIAMAAPMPSATPIRPPISDSVTASTRNWPRMSRRARADRHAQADLARALGDRDQHDVHDADAADEERHRRDRREQQREHAARGFLRGHDLGEVAHREVVVRPGLQAVALAQERAHLRLDARRVDSVGAP